MYAAPAVIIQAADPDKKALANNAVVEKPPLIQIIIRAKTKGWVDCEAVPKFFVQPSKSWPKPSGYMRKLIRPLPP